jgi:hypothetical protein
VQDGALTGGSTTEKVPRNFFLATTRSFQNFDLRLKLKLTGDPKTGMINSGVQIRSLRVPANTEMSGYQVDAGDGWWGKLYDESRRNKVIAEPLERRRRQRRHPKKGDWNDYRILAEGPRLRSWINGVPALDYTEDRSLRRPRRQDRAPDPQRRHRPRPSQRHHSRELPPTPGAPTWDKVGHPKPTPPRTPPAKQKKSASAAPTTATPPAAPGRNISYNAVTTGPRTPEEERLSFHTSARLRSRTRRRRIRRRRQIHQRHLGRPHGALDDDRPRIPRRRQRTKSRLRRPLRRRRPRQSCRIR